MGGLSAYPKALADRLIERDIDPQLWAAAYRGYGTFADFLLASAIAVSVGFRAYGPGAEPGVMADGWTKDDYEEAISQGVELWPMTYEEETDEHSAEAEGDGSLAPLATARAA